MDVELAQDLCAFVDASPSPHHAVAEMARRLDSAGFARLDEREPWALAPGDRAYVVRDGSSIAVLAIGSAPPADAGFRMVGAHTDSPVLKVRPIPDVRRSGYRLVATEPYGGILAYTWLDRDLTLAGRVAVRGLDGGVELRPVRFERALLRVPSLAIHLNREIREDGLRLDPQRHLVPLLGSEVASADGLVALLGEELGVPDEDVLAWDLVTADAQPAATGGGDREWVLSPRLDNLSSCHSALCALLSSERTEQTQVLVANDHEEVGSGSAEGAAGSFLADVLGRVVAATDGTEPQALPRAIARSLLVSCDAAHAVHPNYSERHEPEHRPRLGGGPVLKVNANQSYATDAYGAGWVAARCADAGVGLQRFVTRADLPCGSTIGPLTAARLGVQTVDVGAPLLSMHSCREQAHVADVPQMVAFMRAHFEADA